MKWFYSLFISLSLSVGAYAQSEKEQLARGRLDTVSRQTDTGRTLTAPDTIVRIKHIPRKATFRSAVLPGWGQAYNREYWKIPLVYGVIGVPAGFYIYNTTWYKRTKLAYQIIVNNDTNRVNEIDPQLRTFRAEDLQYLRNSFRKNRDYSILYFLIAWGIQVADATVFAHLKDFDVSDDLTLQLKPGISGQGNSIGLGLVLAVKSPSQRRLLQPLR
ncbi:hypothetical protein EXU57_12760 [Segetibacter sp. 3557_3]|uniref:DUF5683 domain-containing protein n=1 Tax=Segetibacter sp. 3557_3 TaxID=2547429 RepID=UPI001058502D|nr:DUF5683 domain-containing protein [Segetibacter sp. 3557_3]TDH25571.1 hypothetical protein EXU57_12760 [Segetibacter sp. 3557_3]